MYLIFGYQEKHLDIKSWLRDLEKIAVAGDADFAGNELSEEVARNRIPAARTRKAVLDFLVKVSRNQTQLDKNSPFVKALLESIPTDEVPERLVRYFTGVHDYSESFAQCMIHRNGAVRNQSHAPDRILSKEKPARAFAEAIGTRVPKTYQLGVPANQLLPQESCVVKPLGLSGGRGVHIVTIDSGGRVTDHTGSVSYNSWSDFTSGLTIEDTGHKVWGGLWVSEELVRSPMTNELGARDLKAYAFYGELGLFLEISRWGEKKQYCWYDANLNETSVGVWPPMTSKRSVPYSDIDLQEVSRISEHIPAPFCRIDFLVAEEGLVLGELSFRPGQFHGFSKDADRYLGRLYKKAEGRLLDDLICGKQFPAFDSAKSTSVE